MANTDDEQSIPLTSNGDVHDHTRASTPSSISTTSLVFDHLADTRTDAKEALYRDKAAEEFDIEESVAWKQQNKPADKKARKYLLILVAIGLVGWLMALFLFMSNRPVSRTERPHDPHATHTPDHGQKVTLEQVLTGQWYPRSHAIRWIAGPDGEDGLLLERGGTDGFLVVQDVRYYDAEPKVKSQYSRTLIKQEYFTFEQENVKIDEAWPNADHRKVLIRSNTQKLWRHSSTARYWILDVETQNVQSLDLDAKARIQQAVWSPEGDAVAYVLGNNMNLRNVGSEEVRRITTDGGSNLFYGIPDWVYEEEVFAGDSAMWWSEDGRFLAFLRTNETLVPNFAVQYYLSRPSGKEPRPGEENYPDIRQIKYPKAGAPMSVVNLRFYDVGAKDVFEVAIEGDFPDNDRLITEVLWAEHSVIVKSTNRESDILKVTIIDAEKRSGKTVRQDNVAELDGGWFEVSETTTYVPAMHGGEVPDKYARLEDGYIDTVIHNGYDHLAYFSPINNPKPKMLTEGKWEVVKAPSAVDEHLNLVYFIATKADSIERHVYSVDINRGPESIKQVTQTDKIAYYSASFSTAAQFMLLSYKGPGIPWQAIKATPSNIVDTTDILIEENKSLNDLAKKTELPIEIYQKVNIDGFDLNVVERRPPHFDESGKTKYPVLFYLYNGPGFQQVDRTFSVDFQAYVASSLGYVVVTVDGRGTGFLGREHRCIIRGNIGYWEAHDQIAVAKVWAQKKYTDADKFSIWGWSYGGFMTLKVLETDAGETFKYGMAVAPVTDWRLYDSIYTERYMHTPEHNPQGYDNASISDMASLGKNVRFLVMHGASDDNVHFQNTLLLLDKLDQANTRNYDVHVFPDSDHGIYFHNANRVVFEKLSDWLINAFNGEWLKVDDPQPTVKLEGV